MSHVDNRNSSAPKRARTDGGRREDDWTCPTCGNVNFSFRTTCNMRNCTQPRPADHNSKSAPRLMQTPQDYSSPAPYVGAGAPSSMYIGVPPYGSSLFNQARVPPYDAPFSGSSNYHYNYENCMSGGSPFRQLHLSGPTPYSSGAMAGNGGMYSAAPMMNRYGMGLPLGHTAMGPRPGFFPEDRPPNKNAEGTRGNDWTCPKCGNVNFSFRTVCNMRKCNTEKPGSQAIQSGKNSKPEMPEGSWKCEKCNNINYPFRTKCNRQNCGADKPSDAKKSPTEPVDDNDQVCLMMYMRCLYALSYFLTICVHVENFRTAQVCNCCVMYYQLSLAEFIHRLCNYCVMYFVLLNLFIVHTFHFSNLTSRMTLLLFLSFQFMVLLHTLINLKLSTVPVSTRHVCGLRRSRVVIQHCSVWVSESQSCHLPVAAVVSYHAFMVCVKLLY